jgi:hypothetical protein
LLFQSISQIERFRHVCCILGHVTVSLFLSPLVRREHHNVNMPRTPPRQFPVPSEIPLSKKVSSATPYTSMHYKRDPRMNDLVAEMKGKFAGPISPSEFLKTFLPFKRGELPRMPVRRKVAFQRVADKQSEPAMYGPMVRVSKFWSMRNYMDVRDHCAEASLSRLRPCGHA